MTLFTGYDNSIRWPGLTFSVLFYSFLLASPFLFFSCDNNPYGDFPAGKVFLSTLSDDPRTLDPVRVTDSVSSSIASNIHDTPYQYHYLKRPLQLIPSMAEDMPERGTVTFKGKNYPAFRFSIRRGLRFMDDRCFPEGKGREIKIDDIIFSMKRAADTSQDAFGYPLLTGRVIGFDQFSRMIENVRKNASDDGEVLKETVRKAYREPVSGIRKIDDYTLELILTEEYPQIIYFFSLTTGAPVPEECFFYYDGEGGRPTYDRHPVASGPYYLKEWHPKYRIVLEKNPAYRKDDYFPSDGSPGDREKGLLSDAGKQLPLIDAFHFYMIEAGPTIWTLFEQGYLDRAGIPREVFNQVIQDQSLSREYREKGIRLDKDIDVSTFWWYFNMKDPLFANNPKLRQAISLAIDREEIIDRFYNGRGIVAHSVIPPALEGYSESYRNPYSRFDLAEAKKKLSEAGYPGGIDPKTGRPLKITLTLVASQGASSMYRYYIDSLARINVNLEINQLDWPTVLEKKNAKSFQMIHGGWHADYPDPQNFLQLFYGPNSSGPYNENSYQNAEFDRLYREMKNMKPGPEREKIIHRMNEITASDAPVVFLFHSMSYGLSHKWVEELRPHPINSNQLKYRNIDPDMRMNLAKKWNRPPWWAYLILATAVVIVILLVYLAIRQYRNMTF